jgi:hypothetical protein
MSFKVKVVFENKTASVFEGENLIHRGSDPASWSFASNVVSKFKGWTKKVEDTVGHRHVVFLEA